jgi:hypothetical protein
MSSTEDNKQPPVYEDPILQACYDAGYLGFDKQYLIVAIGLPDKEIRGQFEAEEGQYYNAYLKGYYTAQTLIRKQIMTDALNGSSSAQQQMLYYFADVDKEINE